MQSFKLAVIECLSGWKALTERQLYECVKKKLRKRSMTYEEFARKFAVILDSVPIYIDYTGSEPRIHLRRT